MALRSKRVPKRNDKRRPTRRRVNAMCVLVGVSRVVEPVGAASRMPLAPTSAGVHRVRARTVQQARERGGCAWPGCGTTHCTLRGRLHALSPKAGATGSQCDEGARAADSPRIHFGLYKRICYAHAGDVHVRGW